MGAVIDRAVLSGGQDWTALKIGEFGVRRVVFAEAGGELVEHDPFNPDYWGRGHWELERNRVRIWVKEWTLVAELWKPGIYVGYEHSSHPRQGFAVVCVRAAPPAE